MKNGYFKVVKLEGGFGIRVFPPQDGGKPVLSTTVVEYLDREKVPYTSQSLKGVFDNPGGGTVLLSEGDCPVINEKVLINVSEDGMTATAFFFPPSDTGKRSSINEFVLDLKHKGVIYGVKADVIKAHFTNEPVYCEDLTVAVGKPPRHGTDAKIEYYFNTDLHVRPTMKEDGSVDYYHLNMINQCSENDVLARIIPEDPGEPGTSVLGSKVKPRDVKRATLKFGNNIKLSEDKLSISSMVTGHVSLVEEKVFVSNVYTVENVDNSVGNIEFEGSVQVNGNVNSNFKIVASGNVVVNGVVEGASIEAGGNIVIARGMNGMSKGVLKAGGDIIAKFLENAKAYAEGYVSCESILHSDVMAGTEITVDGKRGFVTGGHIQATQKIAVKTLGSAMGAQTLVEVGMHPGKKARLVQLTKECADIKKSISVIEPMLVTFREKTAMGYKWSREQMDQVRKAAMQLEDLNESLKKNSKELEEISPTEETDFKPVVIVNETVYPGTTIVIEDVSMSVQSSYKYCKFEKRSGDVKITQI
ncbi:MAG: FapA family protein [Lachnospiraceae bacterium]|nr:FapA family protein [Lachnospiraceae bacterium]